MITSNSMLTLDHQVANIEFGGGGGGAAVTCEMALLRLMERTGYNIVQENGQRKYGGPPPCWPRGAPPPIKGSEVFVGKLPRDLFEDELVPLFERVGRIYEVRLMMDFSGTNRGYAFVMFFTPEEAARAVRTLNDHEIRRGRFIGVVKSVDNCRLFIGGLPKNKTRLEVLAEMRRVTEGVRDVIIYSSVSDKSKSRGFAFVEYECHKAAAMARRKLIPGRIQLWSHSIAVDWALPEPDVDDDVMSKVTVLYVRNLLLSTNEETIRDAFNRVAGVVVGRVKKLRDFAFVHFTCRQQALLAMMAYNNRELDGSVVEVMWAKPADRCRSDRSYGGSVSPPSGCNSSNTGSGSICGSGPHCAIPAKNALVHNVTLRSTSQERRVSLLNGLQAQNGLLPAAKHLNGLFSPPPPSSLMSHSLKSMLRQPPPAHTQLTELKMADWNSAPEANVRMTDTSRNVLDFNQLNSAIDHLSIYDGYNKNQSNFVF